MLAKIYNTFLHFRSKLLGQACDGDVFLAETVPTGLKFKIEEFLPSIGESLISMIRNAKISIDIASIYSAFLNDQVKSITSDLIGKTIYDELIKATERGVTIRYVVTSPTEHFPQTEVIELSKKNPAKILVGYLNMAEIVNCSSGLQHTKTFIVDKTSFYLGSANSDWRAYSEVAEIGIFGINTISPAADIKKIFDMYWDLSYLKKNLPTKWPAYYDTAYNLDNPMIIGKQVIPVCFSATPLQFSSGGRLNDMDAIINVIENQKSGILRLCAMEFSNIALYGKPPLFLGKIDLALRKATIERDVSVHILVEHKEENFKVIHTLKTLHQYNKIYVKRILVPDGPIQIPFARLFHSKMCIGSDIAWLGTSNITPDYFHSVAGIGCTIFGSTQNGASLINSMTKFFDRYYFSDYSTYVDLSK